MINLEKTKDQSERITETGSCWVSQLDPRSKVLVTLIYVGVVLSFDRLAVNQLIPFLAYPLLLVFYAGIQFIPILKRILAVSLFAVFIGIWSPVLDQRPVFELGSLSITAGWIAFLSLYLKFILTAGAALTLMATTGIKDLGEALQKFGLPHPFINQLLLLHRYLFVLVEDISRTNRARLSRSFGRKGLGPKVFVQMLTTLLLASIERADRIHQAMLSRGFNGMFPVSIKKTWKMKDSLFLLTCSILFLGLRILPITGILGDLILK